MSTKYFLKSVALAAALLTRPVFAHEGGVIEPEALDRSAPFAQLRGGGTTVDLFEVIMPDAPTMRCMIATGGDVVEDANLANACYPAGKTKPWTSISNIRPISYLYNRNYTDPHHRDSSEAVFEIVPPGNADWRCNLVTSGDDLTGAQVALTCFALPAPQP